MSQDQSSKRLSKRSKEKQPLNTDSVLLHSDEDEDVANSNSFDKVKDISENLSNMTEEEMVQHLKLCMKLSAENKINMKNAFGLHLIGIMQKIVNKTEKADIQQASLSLQASSKIYAGRVEALYQDTFRFHGYLQSIVSGGKKEKKNKNAEDIEEMDDDNSESKKSRTQKSKCKSFLKSEESLSIEQDTSTISAGEPHGNFVTINSAFSTSRLAPKLLNSLQLANDSCMLRCAVPELSFKPKNVLNNVLFTVTPKQKVIFEKIRSFGAAEARKLLSDFQELSENVPFTLQMSTPKPISRSVIFDDSDGDFTAPFEASLMAAPSDHANSVEYATEKFDILNITADAFVNHISAAVTDQGIDHRLLPPNSALKKMLDRSRRSIKSTTKTTVQKAKEKFFTGKSASNIKQLFLKGRTISLSQKTLSEWNLENTSNIDLGYEFIEELESKKEDEYEYNPTLDKVLDVIKQNDLQYHFKYYFHKLSQMWKFSRRKLCLDESHLNTSFHNQTEKRVGSIAPTDPEGLALSFQNLSLHDSLHEIPDSGGNISFNEAPDLGDAEDPQFIVPPEPFETDIGELLVKPPELVRPVSMKYDKRPVNLNTEKIKDLMWLIISEHLEKNNSIEGEEKFLFFSSVYEDVKVKLEKEISEFITMQFAFVILLILANEKTLLIENVKENTDLRIRQDVSEIDITNNT